MATKKTSAGASIPKGFKKLEGKCAGFFVLEEGNTIQGRLKGSFVTNSDEYGPQKTFRIMITDGETEALASGGEVVKLTKGAICGLNQKGWLRSLDDLPEGTEIFVKCNGQDESLRKPDQSPPWTFDIAVAE